MGISGKEEWEKRGISVVLYCYGHIFLLSFKGNCLKLKRFNSKKKNEKS